MSMLDAVRTLRDIRDRSVVAEALCAAMLAMAVSFASPQLEALAIEAQRAIQQNAADASAVLDALRLLAA